MRNARLYGIAGLAALAAAVAVAQTTVNPLPETAPAQSAPLTETAEAAPSALEALANTHWGDPIAGATKAGACAACHGLDGNSTDPALYPRLAGQGERYISRQLALFKDGERVNDLMKPFADALSAQDMRDVAAYYTSRHSGAGSASDTVITDAASPYNGMKLYEVGQQIYRIGNAERGIPACTACHGPAGAGNAGASYPQIGGQQEWYLARRLTEYRSGETIQKDRHYFDIMAEVANRLSDEEIRGLASYLQGLHDRTDQPSAAQVEEFKTTGKIAVAKPQAAPAAN